MPVVDLVPSVSEMSRPVTRVELDWGGEVVGSLEMISHWRHLMILTVEHWPVSGPLRQQVTEKLLAAAVEQADERGAVLSIAVPAGSSYTGFLSGAGFQPLAGEVWRRDRS